MRLANIFFDISLIFLRYFADISLISQTLRLQCARIWTRQRKSVREVINAIVSVREYASGSAVALERSVVMVSLKGTAFQIAHHRRPIR